MDESSSLYEKPASEDLVVVLRYTQDSGKVSYVRAPELVDGVKIRLVGDSTLARTMEDPIKEAQVIQMSEDEHEALVESTSGPISGPFPEMVSPDYGREAEA